MEKQPHFGFYDLGQDGSVVYLYRPLGTTKWAFRRTELPQIPDEEVALTAFMHAMFRIHWNIE